MLRRRRIGNALAYLLLIIISVIWLFPFFCLLMQSFRSYATESGGMVNYLMPREFSLDNYKFLFGDGTKFTKWYLNTFIIAVFVTLFQTIVIICVTEQNAVLSVSRTDEPLFSPKYMRKIAQT